MFVAAGFKPRSASARVLAAVRDERFYLIWNQSTRREIDISYAEFGASTGRKSLISGPVDPSAFVFVRDRDARKFAALSAAAKRPLVTNDNCLLADLSIIGIDMLTPRTFLARVGGPHLEAGGTIENAQASQCTKPTHQTVR